MGLAAPKNRIKLSHDPNNTSWTNDTTSFGHKIMASQGWQPGQFLGAKDAPHTEFHTAANASHIRVVVKDNTLGLGAKLGSGVGAGECTGLDAFQNLLGRLNGKGEDELEAEQKGREDTKRRVYVERKWGSMKFVRGGFLVGDKIRDLIEGEAERVRNLEKSETIASNSGDSSSEEEVVEEKAPEPVVEKSKKSRKRKLEEDDIATTEVAAVKSKKRKRREPESEEEVLPSKKEIKEAKKKAKKKRKLDEETTEEPAAGEEASTSKEAKKKSKKLREVNENPEEATEGSERRKRKQEKKERREKSKSKPTSTSNPSEEPSRSPSKKKSKRDKRKESDPSTTTTTEVTSENTTKESTPVIESSGRSTPVVMQGRHAVRARNIAQKRLASMDVASLNQIFMIKSQS